MSHKADTLAGMQERPLNPTQYSLVDTTHTHTHTHTCTHTRARAHTQMDMIGRVSVMSALTDIARNEGTLALWKGAIPVSQSLI
jgi:hypothetical protein